jgi:SAM-dependent methyltransferase
VFKKASVYETGFPAQSMDFVISRFVIEHVTRPDRLIAEAFRLLKPGGVFYLLYPHLMLRATLATLAAEVATWVRGSSDLVYLMPHFDGGPEGANDFDSVWLANTIKVKRLMRNAGFSILLSKPSQSLVVAERPRR